MCDSTEVVIDVVSAVACSQAAVKEISMDDGLTFSDRQI